MFGVLVVVLRRDRVAILSFSAGKLQISQSFVSCSESLSAQVGMKPISGDCAERHPVSPI